jgi:hypothetical protein
MDNIPAGQPAPVAPIAPPPPAVPPTYGVASAPVPAPSPKPGPRRFILPVAGALVIAVVGFAAGFAVANATSSQSTTAANGGIGQGVFGQGNGQGFGPNASGRPRGFGGNTSGTVGSVAADQMTVTTQNGSARIVLLTPTTKVTEVSSASKAVTDITSGATVTVTGTANPDGSVTATNIIIGDVGVFDRGLRPGDDGSPAPSSAP